VVSLMLSTTIVCAVFADDIILVVLGPKWHAINPLAWLLQSSGLQERSLKIVFVLCPIIICSYFIAIPYGRNGRSPCLLRCHDLMGGSAHPVVSARDANHIGTTFIGLTPWDR
jgi:hypothetical protein